MEAKNLAVDRFARIRAAVFLLATIPLLKLIFAGATNGLGANPIEKISHETGFWILSFLLLSLSATPLRHLFGWFWPVRLRRMLGLFAFFYACLHFLTYLVLDQFFDWQSIGKDIVKRPYISVGFLSFLMLIPLALTSSERMIRRLGGKRWRNLHRLVYVIACGGVLHFIWLVKKDLAQPMVFALLLAVLLTLRLFFGLRHGRS